MSSQELIETKCTATVATPPADTEYNFETIDRYGNILPTIIVSADSTLNWKARDYRDLFLSRLTAPNSTKEAAIDTLSDNLVSSGIIGKLPHFYPFTGDNAVDNSLNLSYPLSKYSNEIHWFGSPIHGLGKLQGNGTSACGVLKLSLHEMDPLSLSIGVFRLNTAINTQMCYEIGWGTSNDGCWLFVSNNAPGGSLPSFNNTNYYSRISYAPDGNESGLFVGDLSATRRQLWKNGVKKAESFTGLGLTKNMSTFTVLAAGGGGASPSSLSAAFVGESLSALEQIDLNTILHQFNTDKGALFI